MTRVHFDKTGWNPARHPNAAVRAEAPAPFWVELVWIPVSRLVADQVWFGGGPGVLVREQLLEGGSW